jgi:phosphoenolpyruvate phosphomutase
VNAWQNVHPLTIVPAKYFTTPTDQLRKCNVDMLIWANHNLRASVQAIQVL